MLASRGSSAASSRSPHTALRLGAFFGTTPQFWLRLQEGDDLALARTQTPISAIQPLSARPINARKTTDLHAT